MRVLAAVSVGVMAMSGGACGKTEAPATSGAVGAVSADGAVEAAEPASAPMAGVHEPAAAGLAPGAPTEPAPTEPPPTEPPPTEAAALPPVPEKATEVGCFAMTGDGQAALMAVRSVLTDHNAQPEPEVEDSGISVEWVGKDLGGTLDCFADATTCAGEDTPARASFIAKHGMTGCPAPTTAVRACGATRTLVAKDDALWLEGPTGETTKLTSFTVDEHDGGSHEAFSAAWQHPAGGPLFIGLTNSDTGLEEYLARAVPETSFGRCD